MTAETPLRHATARAPLRVSLGGGGTDLPWYAGEYGGSALVATISCGVSVRVDERTPDDPPSRGPRAPTWTDLAVARLSRHETRSGDKFTVRSLSDVPGGTGLGSSGAYLVALAAALGVLEEPSHTQTEIARIASDAEARLSAGEAGPQDTWASALGGLRRLVFHPDGSTSTARADFPPDTLAWLDRHILLAHSGITRSATEELQCQRQRPAADRVEELHRVKALGFEIEDAIRAKDLTGFSDRLRVHSELKQLRSPLPQTVRRAVDAAMSSGALAAKVVGAGGGGAVLFACPDGSAMSIRDCLRDRGFTPIDCRFSPVGVTVNCWEGTDAA